MANNPHAAALLRSLNLIAEEMLEDLVLGCPEGKYKKVSYPTGVIWDPVSGETILTSKDLEDEK